ncbi:MAG TPA: hypothetical protein VIJ65_06735, partial [Acidobacteriaceae bacterium]
MQQTNRTETMQFDDLLDDVLNEERKAAEAPAGMEQRVLARLLQSEPAATPAQLWTARPFAFAESVAAKRSPLSLWTAVGFHALVILIVALLIANHVHLTAPLKQTVMALNIPPPPPVMPREQRMGGGGGQHDLAPVTQGRLPKL